MALLCMEWVHYTPLYKYRGGGAYWNHFVRLSVHLSVCTSVRVSDHVCSIFPEPFNPFFFTKFGIVLYCHEMIFHAEKFVHRVQCQGFSKSLYKQNITMSVVSYKLPVGLQPNLG